MKKLITLLLTTVVLAAVLCHAAEPPVVTQGPIVPWRIQCDITVNNAGTVITANPQVFYRQNITVGETQLVKDHGSVSWDSVAKAAETISITLADGTTAITTRGAVLAAVLAIAESERTAPPPGE